MTDAVTTTETPTHPAWCDTSSCQIDDPFPDDQRHDSHIAQIPMTLEMPWRKDGEDKWHRNDVMVMMGQPKHAAAPVVDLGIQVPKSDLHPDEPEIWVKLTVSEAGALSDALSRLVDGTSS